MQWFLVFDFGIPTVQVMTILSIYEPFDMKMGLIRYKNIVQIGKSIKHSISKCELFSEVTLF